MTHLKATVTRLTHTYDRNVLEKNIFTSQKTGETLASTIKYNASMFLYYKGNEQTMIERVQNLLCKTHSTWHKNDLDNNNCRGKYHQKYTCHTTKAPTQYTASTVAYHIPQHLKDKYKLQTTGIQSCFHKNHRGEYHVEVYLRSPFLPKQKVSINIHLKLHEGKWGTGLDGIKRAFNKTLSGMTRPLAEELDGMLALKEYNCIEHDFNVYSQNTINYHHSHTCSRHAFFKQLKPATKVKTTNKPTQHTASSASPSENALSWADRAKRANVSGKQSLFATKSSCRQEAQRTLPTPNCGAAH